MDEEKQVTEVRDEDGVRRRTVATRESAPGSVVLQRVVYYIGGVIVAIVALRFIFQLLGAAEGNPFVDFVYGLSAMFVWPFDGIFGEPTYGFSHFDSAALVAIVIYGLVTVGIAKLFALGGREA
jgi:hypothetical protein